MMEVWSLSIDNKITSRYGRRMFLEKNRWSTGKFFAI